MHSPETRDKIDQLRKMAAEGDELAVKAAAAWERWRSSDLTPRQRRFLRRVFDRAAQRALDRALV